MKLPVHLPNFRDRVTVEELEDLTQGRYALSCPVSVMRRSSLSLSSSRKVTD